MINEKIYQRIYNEISSFVSDQWERIVIYLEYGEESYTFSFYVKIGGQYIKCFDLPEVSEEDLMLAFRKIDKIVNKERESLQGQLWTNMTMTIEADGNMHAFYDYTDLSENAYKYGKQWKKQYLD